MNFERTFPELQLPLPREVRHGLLIEANCRIQALGSETTISNSKAVLDTLFDKLALPLAKLYEIAVDEEHANLASEIAFGVVNDGQGPDWFRNKWASTMVSKVFNRTPGVPKDHMLDCFLDYEMTEGRPKPWNTQKQFCAFMARRAIMSLVSDRLPGQALSFFGIIKADLDGIDLPDYVPPDRPESVIETARAVGMSTEKTGFGMMLMIRIFG